MRQHDLWDRRDSASATLHATTCPTCGQEVDGGFLRGSMWHQLALLAAHATAQGLDLRRVFEERERRADANVRAHVKLRSTYKVQKNLLMKCVAAGVPLLREDGKPRGKTELEAAVRMIQTAA